MYVHTYSIEYATEEVARRDGNCKISARVGAIESLIYLFTENLADELRLLFDRNFSKDLRNFFKYFKASFATKVSRM